MNRFLAAASISVALGFGGIAEADSRNDHRSDDERLDRARNACGDRDPVSVFDPWKRDFDPDELRHFDYWDTHDCVASARDGRTIFGSGSRRC